MWDPNRCLKDNNAESRAHYRDTAQGFRGKRIRDGARDCYILAKNVAFALILIMWLSPTEGCWTNFIGIEDLKSLMLTLPCGFTDHS